MTRLLRLRHVEELVGLHKTQIYRAMAEGRFPRPVPILEGGTAVGWVETEITEFIASRIKNGERKRGRPRLSRGLEIEIAKERARANNSEG
jgi:prophage regulatory protein